MSQIEFVGYKSA